MTTFSADSMDGKPTQEGTCTIRNTTALIPTIKRTKGKKKERKRISS